jgi:hypothetical protein
MFQRPSRWRRLKRFGVGLAVLAALAALPVLYIETLCVVARQPAQAGSAPILPAADRREEVNSYLTYPEWSIVHAYEDLAAVTRRSSESDYDYFGAIGRYWSSLCRLTTLASSRGTISGEYKIMLHVIGLSFAAEMGVKGLYEKTVGRVTAFVRGASRTPEDEFALALADDYAAFLRQTPWYEYPFGRKLWSFWTTTPVWGGNIVRKLERRIALSAEWGFKALYARVIGIGAAAAPAPLRIRSVVADLTRDDIAADPRIKLIETRPGASIIETDRYRTFTEIIAGLARRGRNFTEIAGNRAILVTAFAPHGQHAPPAGTNLLFTVPSAARPGWNRLALDVNITRLTEVIRDLERSGRILEHVYDY